MSSACIGMKEPTPEEGKKQRSFLNPRTAADYLKGSHFSLGQDERLNENCLQTAYKRDYPPLPLEGRDPAIRHKAIEKLLPGDDRYLPEQGITETAAEYTQKPFDERPNIEVLKQRLGATHYKQHTDDRPAAWSTTHKIDFVPLNAPKPEMKKGVTETRLVFGDRDKAEKPITSYNSTFQDFSNERARPEMIRMAQGPPTISGDIRTNTWATTQKEHFVPQAGGAQTAKVVQPSADLFGTRGLPFGGISEFKERYVEKPFDRQKAAEHLSLKTTFRQDDGRGYDDWTTTHKESYVPQEPNTVQRVVKESNKSNVPMGGKMAPEEMVTNYKRNYLEWPVKRGDLVNRDSELKYRSQVVFGDPELANKYFETTNAATYQPFAPVRPDSSKKQLQKSHLPLDNWGVGEINIPTYNDHYIDHGQFDDRIDRQELLEKAHHSNLQFPVDGDLHWRTTHKSHFTPKRAVSEKSTLDVRRFQTSHITFGDQRITPFNKDCY